MTVTRYNKNFIYPGETKLLAKGEMKIKEYTENRSKIRIKTL